MVGGSGLTVFENMSRNSECCAQVAVKNKGISHERSGSPNPSHN